MCAPRDEDDDSDPCRCAVALRICRPCSGGFVSTGQWILEALTKAASEDHQAHRTVERFRLSRCTAAASTHRRLGDELPEPGDWSGRRNVDEFRATHWSSKDPAEEPDPTYVQRIGQWPAMEPSDEAAARRALPEFAWVRFPRRRLPSSWRGSRLAWRQPGGLDFERTPDRPHGPTPWPG